MARQRHRAIFTFAESSSANVAKPPSEGGAEQTGKDVSRFRRTAPACGVGSQGQRPRGVEGPAPRPTSGAADLSDVPEVLRVLYFRLLLSPATK